MPTERELSQQHLLGEFISISIKQIAVLKPPIRVVMEDIARDYDVKPDAVYKWRQGAFSPPDNIIEYLLQKLGFREDSLAEKAQEIRQALLRGEVPQILPVDIRRLQAESGQDTFQRYVDNVLQAVAKRKGKNNDVDNQDITVKTVDMRGAQRHVADNASTLYSILVDSKLDEAAICVKDSFERTLDSSTITELLDVARKALRDGVDIGFGCEPLMGIRRGVPFLSGQDHLLEQPVISREEHLARLAEILSADAQHSVYLTFYPSQQRADIAK